MNAPSVAPFTLHEIRRTRAFKPAWLGDNVPNDELHKQPLRLVERRQYTCRLCSRTVEGHERIRAHVRKHLLEQLSMDGVRWESGGLDDDDGDVDDGNGDDGRDGGDGRRQDTLSLPQLFALGCSDGCHATPDDASFRSTGGCTGAGSDGSRGNGTQTTNWSGRASINDGHGYGHSHD